MRLTVIYNGEDHHGVYDLSRMIDAEQAASYVLDEIVTLKARDGDLIYVFEGEPAVRQRVRLERYLQRVT